jgi:hypothetical protein
MAHTRTRTFHTRKQGLGKGPAIGNRTEDGSHQDKDVSHQETGTRQRSNLETRDRRQLTLGKNKTEEKEMGLAFPTRK